MVEGVQCGSPLAGLYGTFFPGEFTDDWFKKTKEHAGIWVNVWRDPDPISAPIEVSGEGGHELAENHKFVDDKKPLNSHSNYWENETQSDEVYWLLRGTRKQ